MKSIVFENKGVIDLLAIRTFGVSAKEGENPIGFFGTGLKYALAILLREGCRVELIADGQSYSFTKRDFEMRGKTFSGIFMNDEQLPFTTELGKNWELWQAFREIYCNCIDESGEIYESNKLPESTGKTVFRVFGDAFNKVYHEREKIILNIPDRLQIGSGEVEVYNVQSRSVFYRGIRVFDLPYQSLFTYNISKTTELTEDRTVKYPHSMLGTVALGIAALEDKNHIRAALTAPEGVLEHELDYSDLNYYSHKASEEFFEVLASEYKANNDKLNLSAKAVHIKRMNKAASKHYEPAELSPVEQLQLDRACGVIKRVWPDFADYPIMVVKNLGQETMAIADQNDKVMVVSKRTFAFGTKFLTSTLIEEFFHLKTGYGDHTRHLQTYLFDSICTIIENHVTQEPL